MRNIDTAGTWRVMRKNGTIVQNMRITLVGIRSARQITHVDIMEVLTNGAILKVEDGIIVQMWRREDQM